jgi:mitochondrial chaperone BCS1
MIRPGRIDFKQFIDYATEYQIINMFLKFYPESNEGMARLFAEKLASLDKNISSAQLQGFLMLYKNQPEQAFKNIENFK